MKHRVLERENISRYAKNTYERFQEWRSSKRFRDLPEHIKVEIIERNIWTCQCVMFGMSGTIATGGIMALLVSLYTSEYCCLFGISTFKDVLDEEARSEFNCEHARNNLSSESDEPFYPPENTTYIRTRRSLLMTRNDEQTEYKTMLNLMGALRTCRKGTPIESSKTNVEEAAPESSPVEKEENSELTNVYFSGIDIPISRCYH